MSSVVIGVERAIVAALNAAGKPCGADRAYPFEYDTDSLPSINVVPTGWQPNDSASDDESVAIDAEWAVMLRASGSVTTPCTEALDPLILWVWACLQDQDFGGTIRELRISKGAYQYDRTGDVKLAQCQIDIAASFDVRRADLSANYNVEG